MKQARNKAANRQPRSSQGTFVSENPMGQPVCVALPIAVDAAVRGLPNRSDWLRRVIVEAAERELLPTPDPTEEVAE